MSHLFDFLRNFLQKFLLRGQRSSKDFHLTRYFSITSFLAFAVVAALLSVIYKKRASQDLKLFGETANVEMAQMLYFAKIDTLDHFITTATTLSDTALATDKNTKELSRLLEPYINNLGITKIKIFDVNGRTIYSTDIQQIGSNKADYVGFQIARQGKIFSDLENHDPLLQLADWQHSGKSPVLHSSYLPIYAPSERHNKIANHSVDKIIGVMEMYRDVTPFAQAIANSQAVVITSIAVSFILLYISLFLIIYRAQNILQIQKNSLKNAKEKFKNQATTLEKTLEELHRTQAQLVHQEKMSSLGQMVAGIAHELNNPTAFVRGNLDHADQCMQDILSLLQLYQQYLPETPADIQAKIEEIDLDFIIQDLPGCLQSMRNGTARIQDIVLSLRTFSHLDESKVKLTNLSENLASIWSLLNYRLLASGIEVIEDYHELPEIESDAAELNQVFFHILSNAIDALEEVKKETDKYIKITGKVIDTTTIEIDIINNGLPIQERIKSRIFDPFFTTKSVGKGSGMGLTICYQIMQKHNGNLAVQSTPTETIFKLVMPIHWQA